MPLECEVPPLPPPPPAPPGSVPLRLRPPIGNESSWASLVRVVRKDDEERIQQYQEKLNTYLVFSGLFCITLSVLLVESFRSLQPNYAAMTVELLKQILAQAQSAKIPAGIPPTSFIPPRDSISHVNTLWIASLGFTVVGVSLGLLLKQWLHEQLRPVDSSPQEELRTSLSRRKDLTLVEFTPLLALVAQVSMATFFAGLCVLTFSVNHAAGYTAVITAVGWASMFVLMVIAPVVSPQCPYKLPYTGPITSYLRSAIYRSISAAGNAPESFNPTYSLEKGVAQTQPDSCGTSEIDEGDIDTLVELYSKRREAHILNIMWDALKESRATPEYLISFAQKVLSSAHPPPPKDVRDYEKPTAPSLIAVMDLNCVPNTIYCTLLDNIADLLQEELLLQTGANDTKPIEWTVWMKEALRIVCADSPYPIPTRSNAMLVKLMHEDRVEASFGMIISSLVDSGAGSRRPTMDAVTSVSCFEFILRRLQGAMTILPSVNCEPCLAALLRICFSSQPHLNSIVDSERGLLAVLKELDIPAGCLQSVATLVLKRLTDDIRPNEMFWHSYIVNFLQILLIIDDTLSAMTVDSEIKSLHERLVEMIRLLLTQRKNTPIFMSYASGLTNIEAEVLIRSASRLFVEAFVTSTPAVRHGILSNIQQSIIYQQRSHPEDTDNDWDRFIRLHVTKTYLLVVKGVQELQKRELLPAKDSPEEKAFKDALAGIEAEVAASITSALDKNSTCVAQSTRSEKHSGESATPEPHHALSKDAKDSNANQSECADSKLIDDGKDIAETLSISDETKSTSVDDNDDSLPPCAIRSEKDRDIAKQCLMLITSIDRITTHGDMEDDGSIKTNVSGATSSFFGDEVIEALIKVSTHGDLGPDVDVSSRIRRIGGTKAVDEGIAEEKIDEYSASDTNSTSDTSLKGLRRLWKKTKRT